MPKPLPHDACPTCEGTGREKNYWPCLLWFLNKSLPCPDCHGTGKRRRLAPVRAPRNVPLPATATGPINSWLEEMKEKHQPDGILSRDPDEYPVEDYF